MSKGNDPISLARIKGAYMKAAKLVRDHGDEYLPVFERLENELREKEKTIALRERAREVAKHDL